MDECKKGIRRSVDEGGCALAGSAVDEGATGYARVAPQDTGTKGSGEEYW